VPLTSRRPLRGAKKKAASGLATAERSDSEARHKALYLNLIYCKRLAYAIGWARLDAFCLVPLSFRSIWRWRAAPNLNQKVENATLKNYSVPLALSRTRYTTARNFTYYFSNNHQRPIEIAICSRYDKVVCEPSPHMEIVYQTCNRTFT